MSNRLENLVGALAIRIGDLVADVGDVAMEGDVAAPASALTTIELHPGITIRWLSDALSLSHPGTVRLVERLVAGQLVVKRSVDGDGRAVGLWLTEKGHDVSRTVLQRRDHGVGAILSCLTEAERSQLERMAEKILISSYVDEAMAVRTCRWCDGKACAECPIDTAVEVSAL